MIEKESTIHNELMEAFGGPPVRVTVSTALNDTVTVSGDAALTLIFNKDNPGFEFITGGTVSAISLLRALDDMRNKILRG